MKKVIIEPVEIVKELFNVEIVKLNSIHEEGVLERQLQLLDCSQKLSRVLNEIKEDSIILVIDVDTILHFNKENKKKYEITLHSDWSDFDVNCFYHNDLKIKIK